MNIDQTFVVDRLGTAPKWQGMMQAPSMPDFGALPPVDTMPQKPMAASQPASLSPEIETQTEAQEPSASQSKYNPTSEMGKWLVTQIESGNMSEQGQALNGDHKGKLWYGPQASAYKASLSPDRTKWREKETKKLESMRLAEIQQALGMVEPANDKPQADPDYLKKLQEELGKESAKEISRWRNDIITQNDIITNAEAFESLMQNEGLKTGVGQDILDATARWLERIGVSDTSFLNANKPATADALRQMVTKNVFNTLLEQKGVQTEGDAQRARETWVRVQNTPEGNKWINDYMKNIAKRKIEMYNFLLNEVKRNGYDLTAAQDKWREEVKTKPSVVPIMEKEPPKPQGEQPGRVAGTPGFYSTPQSQSERPKLDSFWR